MQFNNPVKVVYVTQDNLVNELINMAKGKNVVLFASKRMVNSLKSDEFIQTLTSTTNFFTWISDIHPNPTYKDITTTLSSLGNIDIDYFYAIGGGSCIDTAKTCKALIYLNKLSNMISFDKVLNSIVNQEYLQHHNSIKLVAIPTTAGTGSEMTKWATVWNNDTNNKYSVDADELYPNVSYMVEELTLSLPPVLTISTGLDALSHAVEAYWAKSTNPLVKEIAKAAIRVIVEYLPKVKSDFKNIEYRKKMLTGATLAGMAFSQTRTTAVHSISYPLTSMFKIDHGLAVALVLPGVMEVNLQQEDDIKEILDLFHTNNVDGVKRWIYEICLPFIDLRLSKFGVKEADLFKIAELSFTIGRMNNNPVYITKEQVLSILKVAF